MNKQLLIVGFAVLVVGLAAPLLGFALPSPFAASIAWENTPSYSYGPYVVKIVEPQWSGAGWGATIYRSALAADGRQYWDAWFSMGAGSAQEALDAVCLQTGEVYPLPVVGQPNPTSNPSASPTPAPPDDFHLPTVQGASMGAYLNYATIAGLIIIAVSLVWNPKKQS